MSNINKKIASNRWQFIGAAVLIGAATSFYFVELARHPTDLVVGVHAGGRNDLTSQFLRYRDEAFTLSNRQGEFAGWDPHLQLGLPIQGNAQAGIFYPPNWVIALLGAKLSLSVILVGHMWWAGLGAYLLLRRLKLGFVGALFGGVMTAGTPYAIAHLAEGHYAQISVFAWLPWICWRFECFLESEGRHWKLLSGLVAIAFFAGHVQELYYLMVLLSGCVFFHAVGLWRRAERQPARALLLHWCVMAVASGALVAVDLLPVWLNIQTSVRSGKLPLELAGDGINLGHLRLLINPMSFGGPENLASPMDFYWKKLVYFGVVNLLLAVLAVLTVRSTECAAQKRWVWLAVITIVFSFGQNTPFFKLAYHVVPMIGGFRVPARALFIGSLVISWLAALRIDRFLKKDPAREEPSSDSPERKTSIAMCGLVIVLLLVSTGELVWHSTRIVATIPTEEYRTNSEVAELAKPQNYERVFALQSTLTDYECLHAGIFRVRGYEPVLQTRFAFVLDALAGKEGVNPGFDEIPLEKLDPNIADLMGIRYFITSNRQDVVGWKMVKNGTLPPPTTLRGSKSERIGYGVYENQNPMPRAFVMGQVTVNQTPSDSKKTIEALRKLDCRKSVLLNRDVLPSGARSEFKAAKITDYKANSVTVQVNTDAPGYLVLTDMLHPGWRAYVDGQAAAIEPAYIAFRAVPLPTAGAHEVVFRYTTPGRNKGAVLSVFALVVLLAAGIKQRMVARAKAN